MASNLALALAEIGQPVLMQSVLLIDGDLRRPRLHEIFGVPNRWGSRICSKARRHRVAVRVWFSRQASET